MFKRIWFFLNRAQVRKETTIAKWKLYMTLHENKIDFDKCADKCPYWSVKGFHKCPVGAVVLVEGYKANCIEWVNHV